jgi:hypothetical protein
MFSVLSSALGRAATAETADFRHMGSVRTDLLSAFSPGVAGFIGCKLVGSSALVGGHSALSRNLTLFPLIHPRESTCSWFFFKFLIHWKILFLSPNQNTSFCPVFSGHRDIHPPAAPAERRFTYSHWPRRCANGIYQ